MFFLEGFLDEFYSDSRGTGVGLSLKKIYGGERTLQSSKMAGWIVFSDGIHKSRGHFHVDLRAGVMLEYWRSKESGRKQTWGSGKM